MYRKSLIFLAAGMIALSSCGKKDNNKAAGESAAVVDSVEAQLVRTGLVEKRKIERKLQCTAVLDGWETVAVSPSVTGIIEKINKEIGDRVSAGEVVVRMDQTQLNQAKLAYANVSTEMQRMEALLAGGNTTQQQYDALKLQLDQAKQNLDFLQKNTYFKAECTGVIAEKNYESGELYNGARPIYTIKQVNVLKALVSIPESYIPAIKKGQKMNFTSDIYPGKEFSGIIDVVYPTVDASTHTFQVKVKIPNGSNTLRPGMYVKTVLGVGKAETMLVPYMSVLKLVGSNNRYMFTVQPDGKAKRVDVTLGDRFDDMVEIISDEIKPGDIIVTSGQARLVDGCDIKIIND
ncbi:MAG: efflux RND transporter periplasmic adaptor subunit [Paludibacteraceae bacterium]|jgi:RND family efflux transporter MFP subunit|nr:efflux RND transporter periplasmic adaptor subunit [Bacteroidales bacterium]MEE0083505.1 efflux RND transporter periplasmic adaptor subunit [Paludibacteraceae bacterium]MEE1258612.1 efflux RND transporter periplasmic adaptor subunit [Paludibacteraceae bacterium]